MKTTNRMKTSAAKALVAGCLALSLAACGVSKPLQRSETQPKRPVSAFIPEGHVGKVDVYDPIEGFNRGVYRFNYYFDKYVFLPVVNTYTFIMPDLLEKGVTNVFSNLGDIMNLTNAVLQLKGEAASASLGRLLLNTTVGVGGIFDVATAQDLHKRKEDFGQTLGHYGLPAGPFLVLPILGPSNVRDGLGLAVDYTLYSVVPPLDPVYYLVDDQTARTGISLLKAVDARKNVAFRYYESGSPFEYTLVRWLYDEYRKIEIAK